MRGFHAMHRPYASHPELSTSHARPLDDPFLVFLVLAGLHSMVFLAAAIRYLFYGINREGRT